MLKSVQTLIILTFLAFTAFPQFRPTSSVETISIMPISEVREGMKGIARTVFSGSSSEEFNVEILGTLPDWIAPGQDIIIGRLSGANAERTFVFSGMSGSPVYVDGKLVGAISYSFPFAKEPIAGITPFEQMVSLVEKKNVARSSARPAFTIGELAAPIWRPNFDPIASASLTRGGTGLVDRIGNTMVPIAAPLAFSGISRATLDHFADDLRTAGFAPIMAGSADSSLSPLKPFNEKTLLGGDSVVVHLSRGDVSIAAAGTVTARIDRSIYAFGHQFFGLGSADLPMSESRVVTVIPNANNSFKLTVPEAMVGAMTQDRNTGVFGELGRNAKMLPIRLNAVTSRGRHERVVFESAFDNMLTPLIINVGLVNALTGFERSVGEVTVVMRGRITVKDEEPIILDRRFTGPQANMLASSAPAIPIGALIRANFPGLEITGVDIDLIVEEGTKSATLDRLSVDQNRFRPGDTIDFSYFERTTAGAIIPHRAKLTIPADTPLGTLTLTVADGSAIQQSANATSFVPANAGQLISTINRIKHSDRLWVVLSRTSTGTVIGSSELPNLPPSALATINNDRTAGGTKATTTSVLFESRLPETTNIITGTQSITIEVIR